MRAFAMILCLAVATLSSCKSKSGGSVLQQNATGKPGELMLVMDKEYFEAPMGLALYDLLEDDAPALPQSEPSLRIDPILLGLHAARTQCAHHRCRQGSLHEDLPEIQLR